MVSDPIIYKPFLILLLLNLIKQLSSMNIITAYCITIFGDIFKPLEDNPDIAVTGIWLIYILSLIHI